MPRVVVRLGMRVEVRPSGLAIFLAAAVNLDDVVPVHDLGGLVGSLFVVDLNRQQGSTTVYAFGVDVGIFLRNARANKCVNEPAGCRTHCGTRCGVRLTYVIAAETRVTQ